MKSRNIDPTNSNELVSELTDIMKIALIHSHVLYLLFIDRQIV